DDAGLQDCQICISNSLDEYLIREVLREGACIDSFGVGERLITAKSEPVFGGVYKLSALEKDGKMIPKIKISENVAKITNPGYKKLYRFYDNETGKALADVIALADEPKPQAEGYEIFDPNAVWKRKKLTNYHVEELQKQIFDHGKCVYNSPSVNEIREYCKQQIDNLWPEILRFENPQEYYVDLSEKLWNVKNDLLREHSAE
ncbi:MAG: nicotinate phosphoribosyltransferase, partial [Firmicutes bacterium]|nr:nicotinate phosphoribosyltransferase [Bacillota bacterium]